MQKMKTVFVIDRATRRATDEVQVQWVMDGEGKATIKHDGTSCMIKDGKLFKRFDAKHGKTAPDGWVPCEPAPDPVTGHWPGWLPVDMADPSCRWHAEAFDAGLPDGTFELVGPKVQGNPHGLTRHELWQHGSVEVVVGRTKDAIVAWLLANHQEGLVFHHPDGRMAKVRRKDFGIKW
jgi:hypothetical protein